MSASLSDLPEELKLAIASCFDIEVSTSHQSSSSQKSIEAGLEFDRCPLKQLSLVSRKWNLLTKPILLSRLVIKLTPEEGDQPNNQSSSTKFRLALRHAPSNIETFISENEVPRRLQSLTIAIDESYAELGVALRNPARHTTDIISMNKFWKRIFDHVDPDRLVIISPISILGWLTTVEMNLADAWAFPQMAVQSLELSQNRKQLARPRSNSTSLHEAAWDTELLFRIRPWTHLRLVEGSMLRAYGHYEYFHKVPPTLLRAVATPRSATLTSFSHQVMFPFNTHMDIQHLITSSYYKHIHLQYAPGPNDRTLDDPTMVPSQIDMSDCWREVEQTYQQAVRYTPASPLFRRGSCMESFSTGDYHIESIRKILDEAFALHARAGWVTDGPGRWIRLNAKGPIR